MVYWLGNLFNGILAGGRMIILNENQDCEHIKNIKADVAWLLNAFDVGSCSGPATPAPQ